MRIQTVIFASALLVLSLVQYNDAVPCSDTVTVDCTDCSVAANVDDPDCTTTIAVTTTTVASVETSTPTSGTASTTVAGGTGGASRRRLLRRIRILQRRLDQCRKQAANQRAALIKQIKKLTASANSNNFKDKFFMG